MQDEASESTKEAEELIVEAQQANPESPRRTNMVILHNYMHLNLHGGFFKTN